MPSGSRLGNLFSLMSYNAECVCTPRMGYAPPPFIFFVLSFAPTSVLALHMSMLPQNAGPKKKQIKKAVNENNKKKNMGLESWTPDTSCCLCTEVVCLRVGIHLKC
uniref:Uncharacterized protein n=1 Tax=Rhipicephalus zambeziensis TaxID=60191 RepID=A0A224Y6S1_9ACAR